MKFRRRTTQWLAVLLLVCDGSAVAEDPRPPGPLDQRIDELVAKADPAGDDWITEQQQQHAGARLKEVGHFLEDDAATAADLGTCVLPDARSTVLRPAQLHDMTLPGGVRIQRLDPAAVLPAEQPVTAALEALRSSLGAMPRRTKFKVIAVRAAAPDSFVTEIRVEAGGHAAGHPLQQTATWEIRWQGPDQDCRIAGLALRAFEEVQAPRPLFADCTAAVLGTLPSWSDQLQRGADHWYGKIDAVGELNFMGHHGIAVGDVNGDGLEDVYVAMGTGLPNKLLLAAPDGSVRDTALEAGVAWLDDTKGVLLVDMDNDGDADLVCAIGPTIVICKNDGTGKFNQFVRWRASTPAAFYSLAAADYDGDGDLDLYGCRYVKVSYGISLPIPFHDANNGPTNHLLRNEGNDVFRDVTIEVGMGRNNSRFSLACAWMDYDHDGDPDLYVANDFGRNNLFRNDGGRFIDVAAEAGAEDQAAGMGVSWSDFDADGDMDLHVSNMFSSAGQRIAYQSRFQPQVQDAQRQQIQQHSLGNTLLVNQGDGTFRDASAAAGIRMGRWAWGGRFVDINNDGFDDLVVPNGFLTNPLEDDL